MSDRTFLSTVLAMIMLGALLAVWASAPACRDFIGDAAPIGSLNFSYGY